MAFPRAADATSPYSIDLEPVSVGRTFACFGARAVQGDRTCGVGTVLLDVTADSVIAHSERADVGPGPTAPSPSTWASPVGTSGSSTAPTRATPTRRSARRSSTPGCDSTTVPDDPAIHAALLAQFTGHLSIGAALRPHAGIGEDQAHVTLSCAINAISLSLHADVRADEWMLYRHRSTFAGDGMTHAECRVHDEAGELLASFTVDAMVRTFDDPPAATPGPPCEPHGRPGAPRAGPGRWFSPPVPDGVVFVEPHPRRITAELDGRTVIDTEHALLVHRVGHPLTYAFRAADVGDLPAEPVPEADGYVRVPWDAVDAWFEEGRRLVHYPPNPYHRVDIRPTDRHLRVVVAGEVLVDTDRHHHPVRDVARAEALRRTRRRSAPTCCG